MPQAPIPLFFSQALLCFFFPTLQSILCKAKFQFYIRFMALFFSPFPFLLASPQEPSSAINTIPHSYSSSPSLLPRCTSTPTSSYLAPMILFRPPRNPLNKTLTLSISAASTSSSTETKITDFDAVVDELDPDEEDLAASPWEGAVVYRRDASVAHVEYATTLERLGLAKLASGFSRSRASAMGIRLPARMAKDSALANETPVLISIDVTKRKRRLKLDGILRTVINLRCNSKAEKPLQSLLFLPFSPLHGDGREPVFLPPAENRNTLFLHPAENRNTLFLHPAENRNTLFLHPAENRNTLFLHPAENRNTLFLHPAENRNTLFLHPAENRNTLPYPAENRYPFSPLPGFDAIEEHTGAGHNRNMVMPFGGESPGSEGPES
ncbi:hypothetical protein M5K25_023786 [Dendrobium thyrsiflorum]|uniref:Uncharacterized protein n=1 Tax=Dendrobium thyrsiflorum TaxID=117978 RepID=A0ABD0U0E2_DENTH